MDINKTRIDVIKRKLEKGRLTLKYSGGSMLPTLQNGFRLTVEKASALKEGDVVVFINSNKLNSKSPIICHRIILIRKNKIYAKGDAKAGPDKVLYKEDVLGKVVSVRDQKNGVVPISRIKLKHFFIFKCYLITYLVANRLLSIRILNIIFKRIMSKIKNKVHKRILINFSN